MDKLARSKCTASRFYSVVLLLLACQLPLAVGQVVGDIYVSDRASGSYLTPAVQYWGTGCALFAVSVIPTTTGTLETIVMSISEGPTYYIPRGLMIALYQGTASGPTGTPIMYGRIDKSTMYLMNAGTTNWELPVVAVPVKTLTGYPATVTAGQTYWLALQQTPSLAGATPTAPPYIQNRITKTTMLYATVTGAGLAASGACGYGGYPAASDIGAWQIANNGASTPYTPVNSKGFAVGLCGSASTSTCAQALFPASPTSTRTPSVSRSPSPTASGVMSASPSATSSASPSSTATSSGSSSTTATPSSTPTASSTPSQSPSNLPTQSATASRTATRSRSPSRSVSVTATVTPSVTASNTATESATGSRSPSHSASVTATVTPSATASNTATESASITATKSQSSSITATATVSVTASGTISPTFTPTATGSETPTATVTMTATQSPTATSTSSTTATATASKSTGYSYSRTASPSSTPTPSLTPSTSPPPATLAQAIPLSRSLSLSLKLDGGQSTADIRHESFAPSIRQALATALDSAPSDIIFTKVTSRKNITVLNSVDNSTSDNILYVSELVVADTDPVNVHISAAGRMLWYSDARTLTEGGVVNATACVLDVPADMTVVSVISASTILDFKVSLSSLDLLGVNTSLPTAEALEMFSTLLQSRLLMQMTTNSPALMAARNDWSNCTGAATNQALEILGANLQLVPMPSDGNTKSMRWFAPSLAAILILGGCIFLGYVLVTRIRGPAASSNEPVKYVKTIPAPSNHANGSWHDEVPGQNSVDIPSKQGTGV